MTDVTGIRNARVVLARRFGTAPNYAGFTLGGIPVRASRPFGRSYANRTVPIRHAKPAQGTTTYRAEGATLKFGTAEVKIVNVSYKFLNGEKQPEPARPADAVPIEIGSSISLRPFDFQVVAVYLSRHWSNPTIDVDFIVPDRITGQPLKLTYHQAILPSTDKHYLAEQTSIALAKAFEHEVRERLYLGAKYFIDPHPETSQQDF